MAQPVNSNPALARPGSAYSIEALRQFDIDLMRTLLLELAQHATRLNNALMKDGTEAMKGPLPLKSYTVATVPDATLYTSSLIYVSNETGGATVAFSDGTNWRRVQDRAVVS